MDIFLLANLHFPLQLLEPPVHNDEEDCPELPQNCRRREDLAEATSSKVTSVPVESKENTPPIQGDIHSDVEDCEDGDASTTVQVETSHVRLLKSLEPLKDTGTSLTVHSDANDEHLSTQSTHSRKHPPGRVSQKRKVSVKPLKKLKSTEEPPKDIGTPGRGKKSPVKISRKKPCKRRNSPNGFGLSPLSCKVCNKSFNIEADLIQHVDVHLNDCGLCGHHLEHTETFKDHLQTHKTCDVCGKKFKRFNTLAKHMKILHTRGESLTCTICCKTFREKNLLWSHSRTHKTEKPYSCTICDKSFRHSSTLDRHILLHSGEKPYSCNICGKRFRQKNHVTIHMTTHTGDKPFSCTICDKSFSQKVTLKKHMTMHTKLKLYECPVCGKKLSREDSMRRHRKLHERGKK